ncbi:hypothetical protein GCM10019016_041370 [Streptomyces prasinosporus]|uniref:Uncharacterized protein n=1 Tax=Streptomyces prasinosporus TaxID=68256 RepID=A0ABP6TSG0_9ACTN
MRAAVCGSASCTSRSSRAMTGPAPGSVCSCLGEVGDGGLGACGEPAAGQHQRGGLALALFGEAFGGPGVDGDAHRAGEPGQQFHP